MILVFTKLLTISLFLGGFLIPLNSAQAIPLVYDCLLNDFKSSPNAEQNFQFNPWISQQHQEFIFSDVVLRFYMSKNRDLAISVRSKSNPSIVASVTGYNFPHRMRVSLYSGTDPESFLAVVDCKL